MPKICKFGCGQQLGRFDTDTNKYMEIDDFVVHTRSRCESLKEEQKQGTKGHDLSVEVLLKRLEQLGISIDLNKLRLVK